MSDWPGEQPEHDHPFPPCPASRFAPIALIACAWALRKLEAELRLAESKIQVMLELPPELHYKARAEKAEARVAELEDALRMASLAWERKLEAREREEDK